MSDVKVIREHGLDLKSAQEKVKNIVSDLEETLDPLDDVDWVDDSRAEISGKGFSGHFSVDDTDITVELDLKFFARPFKGKIKEKLEERIEKQFG